MINTVIVEQNNNRLSLAFLEDSELRKVEFMEENRASEGSVYLAKITKKIDTANGRIALMVNIGEQEDALLNLEDDAKETSYSEGQSVIVQVKQEAHGEKGAKVSRAIQLAGKYLVYCPYGMQVQASAKITDKETMYKYKDMVRDRITGQEGWILRTAAVEVDFSLLENEMVELRTLFDDIRTKARTSNSPALLYSNASSYIDKIATYKATLEQIVVNTPKLKTIIAEKLGLEADVEKNPFESFGMEDKLLEAIQKTVKLPEGGSLHIEETKAFVAIDVDSGSTGHNGSISRLNEQAAHEIAKQIILRNLSGKIMIDFAGSCEYRFMKSVIEILEEDLKSDENQARVLGLSRAGNIEILRRRKQPSLLDLLTEECPTCSGTGRVER